MIPPVLKRSTVFLGTAFENRCLSLLTSQLHMSLTRVGGAGDGGVDLRGWWWLPDNRRMRVLVQCKAEKSKLGPRAVREMVGTIGHARELDASFAEEEGGSDGEGRMRKDLMAIICSQSGFTKSSVFTANASPTPMILLHVTEDPRYTPSPPASPSPGELDIDETPGLLLGAVSNPALLSAQGIFGGRMEFRREYWNDLEGAVDVEGRVERFGIGAYWDGRRLRDCRPREEKDAEHVRK